MKKKRLLALLLVLCMTLSLLPFSAFADEDGDGEQGEPAVTGDPAPTVFNTYNVTINYLMPDNSIAAAPYVASLAEGTGFSASVNNPAVTGYVPTEPAEVEGIEVTYTAEKIDYTVENISQAYEINVFYTPAEVSYTVKTYLQNVDDDHYVDGEELPFTGLTGDTIADVTKSYDGFEQLSDYDRPEIAADGMTKVDVYYDRIYYHVNFDLGGGYGVDPVYERYGTTVAVPEPTRAGYTFTGWKESGSDTLIPTLTLTIGTSDKTYVAQWQAKTSTSYMVAFWYENANDNEYTMAGAIEKAGTSGATVYPADYKDEAFTGKDDDHFIFNSSLNNGVVINSDGTTVVNVYYTRKTYTINFCKYTPHTHSGYTGSCYTRTCNTEEHQHTYDYTFRWFGKDIPAGGCYNLIGELTCTKPVHSHSSSCYTFTCTKTEHTHGSGCEYITYTYKWQQDVSQLWHDGAGGRPAGTRWRVDPANGEDGTVIYAGDLGVSLMTVMPDANLYFKWVSNGADLCHMDYYVEKKDLASSPTSYTQSDKFELLYGFQSWMGGITQNEEYVDIEGFRKLYTWDELASEGLRYSTEIDGVTNRYGLFYYVRVPYTLTIVNGSSTITTSVKYGNSIQNGITAATAGMTLAVPDNLDPDGYEFGGWYTTEACIPGTEVTASTVMPALGTSVYAKWVPKTVTISIHKDEGDTAFDSENVYYDETATSVPATPSKEGYEFVGWFYKLNGVEKAFDFNSTRVTENIDVYAKWRGGKLNYTVYYKYGDTEIAAPTTGKASAGSTKTFDAKGGDELYSGYREGYFPVSPSHSLLLSLENPENNVYTFQYQEVAAVPYTVRYLEEGTNRALADPKYVPDNRKAVVTETFLAITEDGVSYLPDQFQKRLVVSVNGTNEIIFYYHENTDPIAPYRISHYAENLACTGYDERQHSETTGNIGESYPTASAVLTINGFTCSKVEFLVAGEVKSTVTENIASATYALPAAGLEIRYYYDRIDYPYTVRYVERGGSEFTTYRDTGSAPYGTQLATSAKTIPGYTPVAPTSVNRTISIESPADVAKNNIFTFEYTENRPVIKYVIVGTEGCASLNRSEETVGAVTGYNKTGAALGATVAVNDGYMFVGWFTDAACTQAAATAEGDPMTVVPEKATGGTNAGTFVNNTTYYAKVADTYNVYFSSTGETESYAVPDSGGTADLTALVNTGYLYGGYFSKNSFESANAYTANGKAMTPVAGTTYYLREINEQDYFKPRLLVTSLNDIHTAFLLTVTDNTAYSSFGFDITGLSTKSVSTTAVTDQLSFTLVNYTSREVNYGLAQIRPAGSSITEGKIVAIMLDGYNGLEPADEETGESFTVTPYYVTKDGIKVVCPTARTITPNGTVLPVVTDSVHGGTPVTVVGTSPADTTESCITVYEKISPYATENAQPIVPNGGAPAIPELSEEEPEPEVIEEETPFINTWQNFFNGIGKALKNIFC